MRYVWGIIWIIIGILVMKYSFQITQLFGKVGWAERYLSGGFGGTYAMYKIAGLLIIIIAMLYMFNALGFWIKPLSPVFGGGA
jgi:hypothetical protein